MKRIKIGRREFEWDGDFSLILAEFFMRHKSTVERKLNSEIKTIKPLVKRIFQIIKIVIP